MNSYISLGIFAALFAFIGFLYWRRRKLDRAWYAFFQTHNFQRLAALPPGAEDPFVYKDFTSYGITEGFLPAPSDHKKVALILGLRRRSGSGLDPYIGVWLPPGTFARNDLRMAFLKDQVASRGDLWAEHSGMAKRPWCYGLSGPPDVLPIRAVQTAEGAGLIAWCTLHRHDLLAARLQAVADLLPQPIVSPPPGGFDPADTRKFTFLEGDVELISTWRSQGTYAQIRALRDGPFTSCGLLREFKEGRRRYQRLILVTAGGAMVDVEIQRDGTMGVLKAVPPEEALREASAQGWVRKVELGK